jgi:hypothetical protein
LGEEQFYAEQDQRFGVEIVKGGSVERIWGVVFWAFFLSSDLNLHTLPASQWFFFWLAEILVGVGV